MNTKNINHERISAFADGESPETETGIVLAALHDSEGREKWNIYHQIGDALRSEEITMEMSPGFEAKLAKRLAAEPAIVAPAVRGTSAAGKMKRFLLPGMAAAAAVATVTLVAAPQLMVASRSQGGDALPATIMVAAAPSASLSAHAAVIGQQQAVMLRDPGLDEYLLAHQRFSPSLYSTAQYARSAAFASDSDK